MHMENIKKVYKIIAYMNIISIASKFISLHIFQL